MEYDSLDFAQAVRTIAERSGVTVPEQEAPRRPRAGDQVSRERAMAALEAATIYYQGALASEAGAGAREYLAGRGLESDLVQSSRGVGEAPRR